MITWVCLHVEDSETEELNSNFKEQLVQFLAQYIRLQDNVVEKKVLRKLLINISKSKQYINHEIFLENV